METRNELRDYCENIRTELEAIYNGEAMNEDTEEQATFYDYFEDVLDIEYSISGRGQYLGARLAVTLGGPSVYINTRRGEIEGYWGSDSVSIWLPSEICSEIDAIFEEYYDCTR